MKIDRLQMFLTRPLSKIPRTITKFWFALSLAFTSFYSLPVVSEALGHQYLISDDGRQHLFWMRQFLDAQLFPNDSIADYFQSVSPIGYASFYRIFAALGIDPLDVARIVPLPLALIAASYAFWLTLEFFPIPSAGFLSSVLFVQNLWMRDDLASASARAFLSPLFLAFLYYLSRRNFLLTLITIVGLGVFYPQYVLVCAGVLCLLNFTPGVLPSLKPRNTKRLKDFSSERGLEIKISLILCIAILIPYALQSSEFGTALTLAEARHLPEFYPGGRTAYFSTDVGRFWLSGSRTGLQIPLDPPLLCAGLLFPVLAWHWLKYFRILFYLFLSSIGLFFLAHLFAFRLHLPSRYTQHSLRIVMAIFAATMLIIILDWGLRCARTKITRWLVGLGVVAIFGYLALYPFSLGNYPKTNYIVGSHPRLYEFFQKQPKDVLIASLAPEANNLPAFAQRSILVGYEYAIPFHRGYYQIVRQRSIDLLKAHYTQNLEDLRNFIETYKTDFFIVDLQAFSQNYLIESRWIRSYPREVEAIQQQLKAGERPALQQFLETCRDFQSENLVVVAGSCMVRTELESVVSP